MHPRRRPGHLSLRTCLFGLALIACEGKPAAVDGGPPGKRGAPAPLVIGAPAPHYSGTSLKGEPLKLSDYRGRVVLLNVWATWCDPCREELPELEAIYKRLGPQGLVVLGVSTDAQRDFKTLRNMVSGFNLTYPVIHDVDSLIHRPFQIIGYPATFVIDRAGNLRWRRDGMIVPNDPELAKILDTTLAEPAPAS